MKNPIIYGLYDPLDVVCAIRYVGYTGTGEAEWRLTSHIKYVKWKYARNKPTNHCDHWLMQFIKKGLRPGTVLIEETTRKAWRERERYWIAYYPNLVNSTAGGEGLIDPSEEVRRRIGAASSIRNKGKQYALGHVHTAESRARISAGLLASEKSRAANLRRGRLGIKRSEETKDKIRQSKLGKPRPWTPEWTAKIAATLTGRRMITDGKIRKYLKAGKPMPNGWDFIVLAT